MEADNALVVALLFRLVTGEDNYLMYAIARGWAKGENANWIEARKQGLTKPMESNRSKSMDELRQKMEQLNKNGKKGE